MSLENPFQQNTVEEQTENTLEENKSVVETYTEKLQEVQDKIDKKLEEYIASDEIKDTPQYRSIKQLLNSASTDIDFERIKSLVNDLQEDVISNGVLKDELEEYSKVRVEIAYAMSANKNAEAVSELHDLYEKQAIVEKHPLFAEIREQYNARYKATH